MQKITKTIKYTAALLLLCNTGLQAQKIKEYYPDGTLSFKGNYSYVWSELESYEYPEMQARTSRWSKYSEMDQYTNAVPRKQYDGKCTFYYVNGKEYYSGTYENGVKQGTFTFYHLNGKLAARHQYDHGMATGTWESWDDQGRMTTQFHYMPIPVAVLKQIDEAVVAEISGRETKNRKLIDSIFTTVYKPNWSLAIGARDASERMVVQTISSYAEQALFKRSIKDGSFKVWKEGKPYMEFYFSQNKPVGIWKLWEDNESMMQINVAAPKSSKEPRPDPVMREIRIGEMGDDPNAIDPGMVEVPPAAVHPTPPANKNFTFVEEMPEFPGGQAAMMTYLSTNIRYPEDAVKNEISGTVYLKFIVTEKGDIEDVQVLRKASPLLDKEAIRVVKAMPKWKPGKQNGTTVRVYYTLPVKFALK